MRTRHAACTTNEARDAGRRPRHPAAAAAGDHFPSLPPQPTLQSGFSLIGPSKFAPRYRFYFFFANSCVVARVSCHPFENGGAKGCMALAFFFSLGGR